MTLEEIGFLICDILSFKADSESFLAKLKNFTNTDWNALLMFSSNYKLAPLLYSKLSRYKNEGSIPIETMELLRNEYMSSAARCAVLQYEIKKILKILGDNNIDVILLKGAYIAERFYEKPGLRPMSDIDILVKKENLNNIFDVLLKEGYTTEILYPRTFHLPIYTKNNILIEVHWDISPHTFFSWKKAVAMNKLFDNAVKENLFGMEISIFPTEHLIVYLCDKVVIDDFRGMLRLLYDIALIISKSEVDWDKLVSAAAEWDCGKDVFCGLYLTRTLYCIDIPEYLLSSLKPRDFNDDLVNFMYGQLFGVSNFNSSCVNFMQMINKNLFGRIRNFFNFENLEILSRDKESNPNIRKITLIFNRFKYLIKQYGKISYFRQSQKNKDISKFYRWLKKS